MAGIEPKITQNVFEARFELGYRFLDRCGDTMVSLETALPGLTQGKVWMQEEMAPIGARLKCPDLDIVVAFDTHRLCVDHNPADKPCEFVKIATHCFDTIVSKFQVGKIVRFGNRKRYIIGTDTIDDAGKLSIKQAPIDNWSVLKQGKMKLRNCDITGMMETPDHSEGIRYSLGVIHRIEAPIMLDKRLTTAPHLLPSGQKEALLNQLRRRKRREKEPLAGLEIDIDYWWVKPENGSNKDFFEKADKQICNLLTVLAGN